MISSENLLKKVVFERELNSIKCRLTNEQYETIQEMMDMIAVSQYFQVKIKELTFDL